MSRTPAPNFRSMPGHLVRRAHQISSALFAEECGPLDLTAVQYAALAAISANADLDATRLSEQIAFDRSTIGGVLERLETKGWIARRASPDDRRVKLLELTQAGRDTLKEAASAVARVQKRLLEPLAPQDRATMMRLLVEMTAAHVAADNPTRSD